MENKSYDEVIGSPDAPYETTLARGCGTATAYHHVGKPSLPNYIAATSGDTHGIDSNDPPAKNGLRVDNLFRQVRASGHTERSYQESMPRSCALESSGRYAVKHNPGAYYEGEQDRAACALNNLPMGPAAGGALAADIDQDRLPTFALITPNLCSDTHDCSVKTGDNWLHDWVPRILSSPAYRAGTTAVFLIWDESTPMPNIVISPTTRPGTVVTRRLDHYSLLRTTEELLGIPSLLGKAGAAASMRPEFGL
jgi:phospholipase C